MKSPCHKCKLKKKSKSNDECLRCKARIAYADAVEDPFMVEGVSVSPKNIPCKKRQAI